MYYNRTIEPFLNQIDKQFPSLLICGPRQVGKTTVLQHISQPGRTYLTLDDPLLASLAQTEPALFLERFKAPLLIDEIQYAPELLPYIKIQIDRTQEKNAFWLTGSQQFHLMKGVSESLAGRVAIVNLLGLSLKEQQNKADIAVPFLPIDSQLKFRASNSIPLSLSEVYQIIWRGSFPAVSVAAIDRDTFYGSYVQTYLQRDIRDLANVDDIHVFFKFLRATAARTGQLINMSDIARDAGISPMTARHWLSVLEASGIIFLLEPYSNNLTTRLIKSPKLYFLDTGLCAYLTEWSSPETLEAGAMSGAILETFIFTEILKSYWHNGKKAPLYFYRDKDGKEIDLLIVQDDIIYPLEFKKTANPHLNNVQSFNILKKFNKTLGPGGVICLIPQWIPLSQTVSAIPVGIL
jgi:hypothetical protein